MSTSSAPTLRYPATEVQNIATFSSLPTSSPPPPSTPSIPSTPENTPTVVTHYLVSPGNTRNWSEDGVLEQLECPLLIERIEWQGFCYQQKTRCGRSKVWPTHFESKGWRKQGMSQVDSLRDCPLNCSSLYTWVHVCNYLSMINERSLIVNQQSTISSQWGKIKEWADCFSQ